MRVAVVHGEIDGDSPPDEQDVLAQAGAVRQTLEKSGHDVVSLACGLNLEAARNRLETICPDAVFNLVESLDGHGRLAHLFAAMLDAVKIPYTGSDSTALLLTNHKVLAKEKLAAAGLPTPPWIGPFPAEPPSFDPRPGRSGQRPRRWIVKSVWEHASFGLDADSVVETDRADEIQAVLRQRSGGLGGACFAEEYVDGREFNVAILEGPFGPLALPPAEILFENFGKQKPRIVDYRAKWDADAFEYLHTPRNFHFPAEDRPLLKTLRDLALRCREIFGLGGYSRVDFRVDSKGAPFILEINANPCLSPDAGFAATLEQAGLSYRKALEFILEDALWRAEDRFGQTGFDRSPRKAGKRNIEHAAH